MKHTKQRYTIFEDNDDIEQHIGSDPGEDPDPKPQRKRRKFCNEEPPQPQPPPQPKWIKEITAEDMRNIRIYERAFEKINGACDTVRDIQYPLLPSHDLYNSVQNEFCCRVLRADDVEYPKNKKEEEETEKKNMRRNKKIKLQLRYNDNANDITNFPCFTVRQLEKFGIITNSK